MDSDDSVFFHKRFDKEMMPGRKLPYCQKHPTRLSYGLIALSYVLILALFIIIVSSFSSESPKVDSKVWTEINSFQSNISELSSKVIQMEKASYKETCEKGWLLFKNYCYYITSTQTDWMKARSFCIKKGSDLVVITSQEEQLYLMSIANMINRYWIGLNDEEEEGTWTWVDGTDYKTSFKFWKKGEPNDYMTKEDCAHLWIDGEWNDVHCTFDRCYAICERKLS
uniref:C-type lectin domain-containing protein n=1 Tax=Leptobrachium leishanense TaxID=445787 RepID=A0A8C5PHP6_9ANUR